MHSNRIGGTCASARLFSMQSAGLLLALVGNVACVGSHRYPIVVLVPMILSDLESQDAMGFFPRFTYYVHLYRLT